MRIIAHASTSLTNLEKRQLFGIGSSRNGAPKQAIMLNRLVPAIDEKATREMKMWGPFKLTASNVAFGPIMANREADLGR